MKNLNVAAFAATSAKDKLSTFEFAMPTPGEHEVIVAASHCGICHSDVHMIDNDWGITKYPLVPGHEVVGKVLQKGSDVTHLAVGNTVGIGWQSGACLECEQCERGDENLCRNNRATCVGRHGGFASHVTVDGRFAFKIPEGLSPQNAAPLLCGGITVYAPLRVFGVKPHHRVGVIGIGGLGHLAVQFAAKMGCEVTAFTSTAAKNEEAMKLGARKCVVSNDAKALQAWPHKLDFIISTVNVDLDWSTYINLLDADGTMCFVGIPPSNLNLNVFSLLGGRKRVVASPIGGRHLMREMLAFAARQGVQAVTEVLPIAKVNEAIEKVRQNKARYRMVLSLT